MIVVLDDESFSSIITTANILVINGENLRNISEVGETADPSAHNIFYE